MIRDRTRVRLFAAVGIFIAVGVGVIWGAQRLIRDAAWVSHTHEVIGTVGALETRLRDAEATQRGYLLTGDPVYLADYRNASAALPEIRDHLLWLIRDNPEQQARARVLWASIDKRLTQLASTLVIYRESGLSAAQKLINQDVIVSSTAVRREAAALNNAERELLVQRGQSTGNSANLLRALALLGIPIGVLMIWMAYRLLVQEIKRRARAEDVAAQANQQLRMGLDRVERSTAALELLNHYGSMLQSCTTPEEALHLTRVLMDDLVPGVAGCIYRIRHSQDHAELATEWGALPVSAPAMIPVDACWALRRGQVHAVMSAQARHCPHHGVGPEAAYPAATLCVPLLAQSSQFGVLSLTDTGTAIADNRDLIQAASEQLSMALANLSLQDRLRQQSIRDPLTGLFNRRYLEESANRELTRCARRDLPLSMLMLDIDNFKSFNDINGHAAGDAVLSHFGQLLQSMSRGEDIACRYGGEEFTLILPEVRLDVASTRAEEIRQAVEAMQIPHLGKLLPQVTVSIGVAAFPVHARAPEALMQIADEALYRAKRAGRNRIEVAGDS